MYNQTDDRKITTVCIFDIFYKKLNYYKQLSYHKEQSVHLFPVFNSNSSKHHFKCVCRLVRVPIRHGHRFVLITCLVETIGVHVETIVIPESPVIISSTTIVSWRIISDKPMSVIIVQGVVLHHCNRKKSEFIQAHIEDCCFRISQK